MRHALALEKEAGYGGGNSGKTHTPNRTREGFVVDCRDCGAWKRGPVLHRKQSGDWAGPGTVVYRLFGHSWARLAGRRLLHRLSVTCERRIEDK